MLSQGDSIYDFVDKRDHAVWTSNLAQAASIANPAYSGSHYEVYSRHGVTTSYCDSSDRRFVCRMYRVRHCRRLPPACSELKMMYVSGHLTIQRTQSTNDQTAKHATLFFAVCTSTTATSDIKDGLASYNTTGFQSVHSLDMKYREISHNGQFYLGYSESEMTGRSWYEFIHPDDLAICAKQHMHVVRKRGEKSDTTPASTTSTSITVRQQTNQGQWIRLRVTLASYNTSSDRVVICVNQVLGHESSHIQCSTPVASTYTTRMLNRQHRTPLTDGSSCLQTNQGERIRVYHPELKMELPTSAVLQHDSSTSAVRDDLVDYKTGLTPSTETQQIWTDCSDDATDQSFYWRRNAKRRAHSREPDEWSSSYSQRLAPVELFSYQDISKCSQPLQHLQQCDLSYMMDYTVCTLK